MDDTWLLKCRDEACYYKHPNHWHLVEKLRPFIDFLVKCFCTVTVSMLDFFVFLQLYCIWFSVFEKNSFIFSPKNQHFLISDICFFFLITYILKWHEIFFWGMLQLLISWGFYFQREFTKQWIDNILYLMRHHK